MNRVVITGVGLTCSLAEDYSKLGPALRRCEHTLKPVTLFETKAKHPVGEVKDCINTKSYFRTGNLAFQAIEEALGSGDMFSDVPSLRRSLAFSTCTIGMLELENAFLCQNKQADTLSYYNAFSVGEFANNLAEYFDIKGDVTSFSTACSSSLNAIAYGEYLIREGGSDLVIAGGVDSLCRLVYYGFQSLKVMGEFPCTPFDKNRMGMNIGEGAGFLILESFENAMKKKRRIYGEILGSGMSADAYHMTAPNPQGEGAKSAMEKALKNAKLSPDDIGYISAHGTGTMQNDPAESAAIKSVFGKNVSNMYVSSMKSYLGHTLGASGSIAVLSALKTFEDHFIPPTLGLKEVDETCDIHHTPAGGLEMSVKNILINAFAFGGNNTSLILGNII